ncbi:MAG: TolC family protein [Sedimentisphaeraceae bacterium JB056]
MNITIKFLFAILCCMILTSCAQKETELDIELDVPQSLDEKNVSSEFSTSDKWWENFGDADLNNLISTALDDNLSLNQMWQRVEQAKQAAAISGADLAPSVDISGNAERNRTITTNDKKSYSSLYSTGLIVNYELDIWGRVAANAAAGIYQWQASEEDYNAAKISIASQIANAWFGYIETNRRIQIINQQIKLNEDTLDIITMQFKRGQAEAVDVLQQRQLLESSRGDKTLLNSQLDILKTQLAVLTGKSPGKIEIPTRYNLPEINSMPQTGSVSELLNRRPDIKSAYLKIKSYDRTLAAAVANKMPKINLSAAIVTSDDQLKGLFDSWQSNIAADLIMPLFDSGKTEAEVKRQEALKKEATYAYIETVYNAIKEVRDALSQERNQELYLESLSKQMQLSKQSVERIFDSYTKGRSDFLRLLSVQLSDQNLELSIVSARKNLISYRIDIYKALAGKIEI